MKIIAGVDEVGRGSLIGPVYAAAVILNKSINRKLLKDSKSLSKNSHVKTIRDCYIPLSIAYVSSAPSTKRLTKAYRRNRMVEAFNRTSFIRS